MHRRFANFDVDVLTTKMEPDHPPRVINDIRVRQRRFKPSKLRMQQGACFRVNPRLGAQPSSMQVEGWR
jgi:hypothetical protein